MVSEKKVFFKKMSSYAATLATGYLPFILESELWRKIIEFEEFKTLFPSIFGEFNAIIRYLWTPDKKCVKIEISRIPHKLWGEKNLVAEDFNLFYCFRWAPDRSSETIHTNFRFFLGREGRDEILKTLSTLFNIEEYIPIGAFMSNFRNIWRKLYFEHEKELFMTEIGYPMLKELMQKRQQTQDKKD